MTAKHTSPEWRRTARIIRAQVRQTWTRGEDATCWRCGGAIPEGAPYDVGHIDPFGGESVDNAAPEHRAENRRAGGRMGARITNAAKGGSTFQKPHWIN